MTKRHCRVYCFDLLGKSLTWQISLLYYWYANYFFVRINMGVGMCEAMESVISLNLRRDRDLGGYSGPFA
jgi:hypothetical protein